MFKFECCVRLGAFECGLESPNATDFLSVTVPPYRQRFTPNHVSMNRLLDSQQSILETSVGKSSCFSTLNR